MEKKNISIELVRVKGETMFSFTVDPFITDLYKKQATETKTSANWAGLQFYSVPSLTASQSYKAMLANYNLFDDYGQPLFVNGGSYPKMNIAWLRTVANKGKIAVNDTITVAELARMVKSCSQFLRDHFAEFFQDATIKGNVSIEL